jgi:hypothetical protein
MEGFAYGEFSMSQSLPTAGRLNLSIMMNVYYCSDYFTLYYYHSMKPVYVLDRYTNKNFLVKNVDEELYSKLRHGDKIVYEASDQT